MERDNKIVLVNQNLLNVSGISKILDISETQIAVEIGEKQLNITGENMEATKLDVEQGLLDAIGNFNSFKFSGKREKTSLIKKIFK